MAEKIVNYTPEQTASMIASYAANPTRETVKALAAELGKSERSVIAKLSREHVYVKPERVDKTGAPVAKKDALVGEIAEAMHVTEDKLDGLEKAPKAVLRMIRDALAG